MASKYVDKHLNNLKYDIYSEAEYGRNGVIRKEAKLLWQSTIKEWNTVYAICIDKEYGYNGSVISYTLRDFSGKTVRVSSKDLKVAIALNKIDVINLSLFIDDNGGLGKITELNMYNANSIDEINNVIQNMDNWEHYSVGNINIGYFEMDGKYTVLDYKGYCNKITLPSVKYMSQYLLSFNDYVQILNIPNTFEGINLGLCFGSRVINDIYLDFDTDRLLNVQILNCHRDGDTYRKLRVRDDVHIHALHFNMSAISFFDMLSQRGDLSVQLKIKQSNIDIDDPLQAFIIKSKMIGVNDFNIDFSKRTLIAYTGNKDVDVLKLPPVKSFKYRWFKQDVQIGTLYLPGTLETTMLNKSAIPNKEEYFYDSSTDRYRYRYSKLVDKVVIPKESSVKFIYDGADTLGIIFETENGVGTADKIAINTPNTGMRLKVIDLVEYPDVQLKNGNTIYGHTRAIIEDSSGNRKSVMMHDLIDKVLEGVVQLINADILLNRTIRIK